MNQTEIRLQQTDSRRVFRAFLGTQDLGEVRGSGRNAEEIRESAKSAAKALADKASGPALRSGMRVRVYERPLTADGLEGVAKLVSPAGEVEEMEGARFQKWTVSFPGDSRTFLRTIRESDIKASH